MPVTPVTIVLRGAQSIPLTNNEVDANFTNLKTAIDLYTAEDVLNKLKTVDIDNSGLNASTLESLSVSGVDQIGNTIVRRVSGGFSAGVITATQFVGPLLGNVTGNATGLSSILNINTGGTGSGTATGARISLGIITSQTGSVILPKGTTVQRDTSPLSGYIRYNTETNVFEGYNDTSWVTLSSAGGWGA